jgi:hypothetical protein
MKIEAYLMVNNEELIIPYVMRHYGQFAKVIFMESNSTDRSVELGLSLGAWVHQHEQKDELDDLALISMKENCWKGSQADWVIVADADEFVYHPNIVKVLEESKATVIHPTFHNMFSEKFPTTKGQIYDEVNMGTPDGDFWLSKMNVFRPKEITSMKFAIGGHHAYPEGNVVIDNNSGIKTLHMNFLGREYVINRYRRNAARHSQKNKAAGYGVQHLWTEEKINAYFDEQIPKLIKIV